MSANHTRSFGPKPGISHIHGLLLHSSDNSPTGHEPVPKAASYHVPFDTLLGRQSVYFCHGT